MKPTHQVDGKPAITFRPAISVTESQIAGTIMRMLLDQVKKITPETVQERLHTQLTAEGLSCSQHLDAPFTEERELAIAYTNVLFPAFTPEPGEDRMSQFQALVDAHKPGKAGKKQEEQGDSTADQTGEPQEGKKKRGRPGKKDQPQDQE